LGQSGNQAVLISSRLGGMIVAHYLSQADYMKTLITVGDAPRREPPNDPKKPPVKSPPRKRKSPVKEPPEPSDIQDPPPRRKPPMGDPPRPGSRVTSPFSFNDSDSKKIHWHKITWHIRCGSN